jgi:hypothetical protein
MHQEEDDEWVICSLRCLHCKLSIGNLSGKMKEFKKGWSVWRNFGDTTLPKFDFEELGSLEECIEIVKRMKKLNIFQ